jgi:hypothetical protein
MTTTGRVHATNTATELADQLAAARLASVLAVEKARDAQRYRPEPPPETTPGPSYQGPGPGVQKPPAPPPAPTVALPPGAVILTAEEMQSVLHLIDTHPETRSQG